jgi:hypothetical protein
MDDIEHYEVYIERIFEKFQPHPSHRFHQRMAQAPWQRGAAGHRKAVYQWGGFSFNRKFRLGTGIALALLIAVSGILLSSSIKGAAQNLMRFIRPAASDQIAIQVGLPSSQEVHSYSAPGYFSLTVDQAQELAGFQLHTLNQLQFNIRFEGAHFNTNTGAVVQRYTHPEYTLFFSQRRLEGVEEYSEIGGSAPVEIVLIHGMDAEYASGGWRLDSTIIPAPTIAAGTQTSLDADWDASIPQKLLRWQQGSYALEILVIEADKLDKSELIKIAESVK